MPNKDDLKDGSTTAFGFIAAILIFVTCVVADSLLSESARRLMADVIIPTVYLVVGIIFGVLFLKFISKMNIKEASEEEKTEEEKSKEE